MTGREHHDEQTDPTGVRAILAALPDPGPMPADVIDRISASLAAEQQARPGTSETPVVDLAEHRSTGHRRVGARLPSLALAASVVVLAGAVLLGVLALTGRFSIGSLTTASGGDTASMDTAAAAEREAAGPTEEYSADDGAGAADGTADSSPEGQDDAPAPTTPMSVAAAPVFASDADLTVATIASHAAVLRARALDPQDNQLEGLPSASPVSSPTGAADCLSTILNADSAGIVSRLVAIDFVDYDGAPAAMLLLRDVDPAPRSGDGRAEPMTAYLVPADCGLTHPHTLTDPVRLDS